MCTYTYNERKEDRNGMTQNIYGLQLAFHILHHGRFCPQVLFYRIILNVIIVA